MRRQTTRRMTQRAIQIVLCGAVCLACAGFSRAATPDDCSALRKHGHRDEAQKCYELLTAAHDPYVRAEGYWGTEQYQEANNQFRLAVAASPANARTPWTVRLSSRNFRVVSRNNS